MKYLLIVPDKFYSKIKKFCKENHYSVKGLIMLGIEKVMTEQKIFSVSIDREKNKN